MESAWVQAASTVVLVGITIWYAFSARRMAQEAQRTRQQSLRPTLLVEPIEFHGAELIYQGLIAEQGELPGRLDCRITNVGPGPAVDVEALLEGPEEDVKRKLVVFPADGILNDWTLVFNQESVLRVGEEAARSARVRYKDVFGNKFLTVLRIYLPVGEPIIEYVQELQG